MNTSDRSSLIEQQRIQEAHDLLSNLREIALGLKADKDKDDLTRLIHSCETEK